MIHRPSAAAAAAACVLALGACAADHTPSPAERAELQSTLTAAGFTSWRSIERDGDTWVVDDAIGAEGETYDVELDRSYAIKSVEQD